jgi:hypothetical protein
MIHDTEMSQWIPPTAAHLVTGTWTKTAGQVANTIVAHKAAADETAVVTIPILLPSNSGSYKGVLLTSIDVYWEVVTAALDAIDALVYKVVAPTNGAAIAAPTSVAFSYDAGHDTAAERLTLEQHTMALTLTTPAWIDDGDVYQVELTVDAALTSIFELIGARANFTLRL